MHSPGRAVWLRILPALGACATPDYVGSRDCEELAPHVSGNFLQICQDCQAAECTDMTCAALFPCVDAKIVVQGCDDDEDCVKLDGAQCGLHSTSHVCLSRAL
jgi:uncharacterized protein YgiB involved in biofilm formation